MIGVCEMFVQRPGQKIITIGNPGLSVTGPRGGAIIPWYLAGGVDPAHCIAAYQPKGAASYAASKINLANPGTYDITEKNAGVEPSWSAENGWYTYRRNDDPMLLATLTGLTLAKSWTIITMFIRPATATGIYLGRVTNANYWGMYGADNAHALFAYWGGSNINISDASYYTTTFTVHCIANGIYYRDGEGFGTGGGTNTVDNPVIGYMGNNNYGSSSTAKLGSAAIYNTTLTPDQVAAISAAMAAL